MANLFNIGGGAGRGPAAIAGFRVQTSLYGQPIPIVYGRARVAGNVIHLMDFLAVEVTDKTQHSKILGFIPNPAANAVTGYKYQAALALALCEGPIAGIGNVWKDKEGKVDFAAVFQTQQGWVLFTGTSVQAAWSYTTSNHADQAVPYQFTAYVANPLLELPNASLSNYSWEVKGFLPYGGPNSILDASPADIANDYLTNPNYGVGFPASKIASLTSWQDYCAAAGLFASPVIGEQRPARQHLEELLEISNTGAVWSDGRLKFVPYGDVNLTANARTFTANVTPLYDLTDNDFLSQGEGVPPVKVTRRDPADIPNVVTVEIEDRAYDYNPVPYKAEDQDQQLTYGVRPLPVLSLHAIKDAAVARNVAQYRLQREQNIRNTYDFRLGMKYSLLEPMDLVTLTDSGLGLARYPVRVVKLVELETDAGFAVTAEDWPFGTASTSLYGSQGANGFAPDTNSSPGLTTPVQILEPPTDLLSSSYDVWIAAAGGTQWGGCDIYLSFDNVSFTNVGRIGAKSAVGTTTAILNTAAQYPTLDAGNTLSVDISNAAGRTLRSASAAEFSSLISLCYVGGEWLAYNTATLTGTGRYNLTSLYRGLYGTSPGSRASASPFVFFDDAVFRLSVPGARAGQTMYFKFASFNTFGNAVQDLSGLSSVSFTPTRDPILEGNAVPQGTVSINPDGSGTISVDGPAWVQSYKYLTSTSAFPSDASVIAGGTIVNGRQVDVAVGAGTLTLGQTIYATFVPYRGTGATFYTGNSIRARGTYQDFSATKTVYFGCFSLSPATSASAAGMNIQNGYAYGAGFTCYNNLQIPQGTTITGLSADAYTTGGGGANSTVTVRLYRVTSSGVATQIGNASVTNAGGAWSVISFTCSESTTANRYQLYFDVTNSNIGAPNTDQRVAGYYVTYTVPSVLNGL